MSSHHAGIAPHKKLQGVVALLFLVAFFVVFSVTFYQRTQLTSRAMDPATFRSLLVQKGITLPSPLPATMSETQYSQLAQFAGISVTEAKDLFSQLKAEEASGSATLIQATSTPAPTPESLSSATPTPTVVPTEPVTTVQTQTETTEEPSFEQLLSPSTTNRSVSPLRMTRTSIPANEGYFMIQHADNIDGETSSEHFFLYNPNTEGMQEMEAPVKIQVRPGSYIRVSGERTQAGLLRTSDTAGTATLQILEASRPELIQAQAQTTMNTIVVLTNYNNAHASSPTATTARNLYNGNLNSFYQENSFGRTGVSADAVGWYNVNASLSGSGCDDLKTIATRAIKVADPVVNFTQYSYLHVVIPNVCPYGGIGYVGYPISFTTNDGNVVLNVTASRADNFGLRVSSHELGHNLGAYHANTWDCGAQSNGDPDICKSNAYKDPWDAMGNGFSGVYHFGAYHKTIFGWLNATNKAIATQSGTFVIEPIDRASSGLKHLRVQTNVGEYMDVESRTNSGFDIKLPTNATSGILVHYTNDDWWYSVINGGDTHLIDSMPSTTSIGDSGVPVGKTLADPYHGIGIQVLSKVNGVATVKVVFVSAPILTSPAWEEHVLSLTPTFTWQPVADATGYTIQTSLRSDFATTLWSKTATSTTYTSPTVLPANSTVYWRVRANVDQLTGRWSPARYFSTAQKILAPVQLSPANNTKLTSKIFTLSWKKVVGSVKNYQLQISTKTGTDFESGIIQDRAISDLSYTIPSPTMVQFGTRYYWRVRAIGIYDEQGLWSAIWSVITPLDTPTLLSPANGTTSVLSSTPTFDWTDSENATGYTIQLTALPSKTPFLTAKSGAISSYTPTSPLPEGKEIIWKVQATSAIHTSLYTDAWSFISADAPTTPVPTAPTTNSVLPGEQATLNWKASTSPVPATYEVQVSTLPGATFESGVIETKTDISSPLTTYTTNVLSRGRIYYWRVRAKSASGVSSAWSTIFSFKVKAMVPILMDPPNGNRVSSLRPTLDWSDSPNASNYYIQISKNTAFSSLVVNKLTNSLLSQYTPTADLQKGLTFYWRVYAVTPAGNSTYSEVFSFTTPTPPVLLKSKATPISSETLVTNIPVTLTAGASNRLIVVGVSYSTQSPLTPAISALTFGGTPLQKAIESAVSTTAVYATPVAQLYYLSPTALYSGTTLHIEKTASALNPIVTLMEFDYVNQTNPLRNSGVSAGGSVQENHPATHTVSVPTTAGDYTLTLHTAATLTNYPITPDASTQTILNLISPGWHAGGITSTINGVVSAQNPFIMNWQTGYENPWNAVGISLRAL